MFKFSIYRYSSEIYKSWQFLPCSQNNSRIPKRTMAYGYFWVRVKGKEAFKRAPQKQNEEVEDPWLYVAAPSVFQSQSGTCSTLYIDFRTVTESQENRSHRPYNHTSTTSSFYARWNMSVSTTTFLKTCMLVSYLCIMNRIHYSRLQI